MFQYSVYGVTPIRSGSEQWVSPVSRTQAVERTRSVQRTWVEQYGNAGQPQRSYGVHRAGKDYLEALRKQEPVAREKQEEPRKTKPAEPMTSADERAFLQETRAVLPLRSPAEIVPADYIVSRSNQLSQMLI